MTYDRVTVIWDQKDQKVLAFLSFPSVFSPVGHKCSGVSDKGNHIVTDRYRVSSMGMDTHTGGGESYESTDKEHDANCNGLQGIKRVSIIGLRWTFRKENL